MSANGEGVNWAPATPKCSFMILYNYYVMSQFLKVVTFINTKL